MLATTARQHLEALRAISASAFLDGLTATYDRLLVGIGEGEGEAPAEAIRQATLYLDKMTGPLMHRLEKGLAAGDRDCMAALAFLTGRTFETYPEALAWVKGQGAAMVAVVKGPFR